MSARAWVVCDVDGVLAEVTHRLHFIQERPKDWGGFFGAVSGDAPRHVEIAILRALSAEHRIALLTGRPERTRGATRDWLYLNAVPFARLHMRKDGDRRPDHIIKPELMAQFHAETSTTPDDVACVFEDRTAVVKEWRNRGYLCFQNTDGDF